mgnify:CR=1 FL=1
MIKPKPTEYDGHLFRSRLEARWAVFFNEMKWKYHYELEDIRVEHKGEILRYLPDFYVIIEDDDHKAYDQKAFIEVKGPRMTEVDEIKVLGAGKHFKEEGLGAVVYVFQDIPTVQELKENDGMMVVNMAYVNIDDIFSLVPIYLSYDGIPAACDKARKAQFEHGVKG